MYDQWDGSERRTMSLRALAEQRLASNPPPYGGVLPEEALHELLVHQIDLEMQNEVLRQSEMAL